VFFVHISFYCGDCFLITQPIQQMRKAKMKNCFVGLLSASNEFFVNKKRPKFTNYGLFYINNSIAAV